MSSPEHQRRQRIDKACERLRRSRAQLVQIARGLSGAEEAFPRSHLMRALTGRGGKLMLGGAGLTLVLLKPRLLKRLPLLMPLASPALQHLLERYLTRKFLRHLSP